MSAQPVHENLWSVPVTVAEIPETGRHVDAAADERTRAAIAKVANAISVPRLEAEFDLTRFGREGVRVVGSVSATVEQRCVLTLEPMETRVEEAIDLMFAQELDASAGEQGDDPDPPEALRDGVVDLGAVAVEFLLLGIDPYPRKPGAVFNPPQQKESPAGHPFAALAALKKGPKGPEK